MNSNEKDSRMMVEQQLLFSSIPITMSTMLLLRRDIILMDDHTRILEALTEAVLMLSLHQFQNNVGPVIFRFQT